MKNNLKIPDKCLYLFYLFIREKNIRAITITSFLIHEKKNSFNSYNVFKLQIIYFAISGQLHNKIKHKFTELVRTAQFSCILESNIRKNSKSSNFHRFQIFFFYCGKCFENEPSMSEINAIIKAYLAELFLDFLIYFYFIWIIVKYWR